LTLSLLHGKLSAFIRLQFSLIVWEVSMARREATGVSAMTIRFGKGIGAVRALPKAKGKRPGVIIFMNATASINTPKT
jgi:hypothetical protein